MEEVATPGLVEEVTPPQQDAEAVTTIRAGQKTRSSQTRSNSLVSGSARLASLEFLNELSLGFSSVV
jgi:hypothetical protein